MRNSGIEALIITAEYDPLRDEGEAYGNRMAAAGVKVRVLRHPGMMHAFIRMLARLDAARDALNEVSETLREVLALN